MSRQSVGFVVQRAATAVAGLSLILQLGSCSRGNGVAEAQGQGGGRGGGRGDAAVPVTTARAIEKPVPVEVTHDRHRRSALDRRSARAGRRTADERAVHRRPGRPARPIALHDRSAAVRSRRPASRSRGREGRGAGQGHGEHARAQRGSVQARAALAIGLRRVRDGRHRRGRDGARRQGRARDGEAAAAVHEDPRAGLRPDGRPAGPPGQPRTQHGHDAARRDQSDRADSRGLRGARPVSRHDPRRSEPMRR